MIDPKAPPWWKVLLAGAAVVGTTVATGAVMMVAIAGKPAFLEVHSAPLPHGACPCSVLLSRPLERGGAAAATLALKCLRVRSSGEVLLQRH